jgi:hypothetical protein
MHRWEDESAFREHEAGGFYFDEGAQGSSRLQGKRQLHYQAKGTDCGIQEEEDRYDCWWYWNYPYATGTSVFCNFI